jgi:phosphoribosylformylglycinamidine synthase
VGLIEDADKAVPVAFPGAELGIVLLGSTEGWLGRSFYLSAILDRDDGAPPPVDLALEKTAGDLVRRLIADGLVAACHDLSDGGAAVALVEMALAGNLGCRVDRPADAPPAHAFWFGEDQARYLVATGHPDAVVEAAMQAGVEATLLGTTGGDAIEIDGEAMPLAELRRAHEGWLPAYMADEPAR